MLKETAGERQGADFFAVKRAQGSVAGAGGSGGGSGGAGAGGAGAGE